jgi:cobalt/nickel transport system permease protein
MDELGAMDTPAHRLDARAKILVTLAFVVAVMSFPRHAVAALTPFLFYPLIMMAAGRLPAGYLLGKVLLALPFVLFIAVFNPFWDRQVMMRLGSLDITGGWLSFSSILLRFVLTVTAALVLVACTGMYRLCAGLKSLGVPRVFVVQLLFLYRYLFVITAEALRMARSLACRAPDRRAMSWRVYGSLVGHLFLRSMDRAQRVYRAMLARGFSGEIRVADPGRIRAADIIFAGGCILGFVALRYWNLAGWLGRQITEGVG